MHTTEDLDRLALRSFGRGFGRGIGDTGLRHGKPAMLFHRLMLKSCLYLCRVEQELATAAA